MRQGRRRVAPAVPSALPPPPPPPPPLAPVPVPLVAAEVGGDVDVVVVVLLGVALESAVGNVFPSGGLATCI